MKVELSLDSVRLAAALDEVFPEDVGSSCCKGELGSSA